MAEKADALLEVAASARATDATLMVVFFGCYRRLCNDCANVGTILPEFGTSCVWFHLVVDVAGVGGKFGSSC